MAVKTMIDSKQYRTHIRTRKIISKKENKLLYKTLKTITQFMSIIIEITPSNYTKAEIEMTRKLIKLPPSTNTKI